MTTATRARPKVADAVMELQRGMEELAELTRRRSQSSRRIRVFAEALDEQEKSARAMDSLIAQRATRLGVGFRELQTTLREAVGQ